MEDPIIVDRQGLADCVLRDLEAPVHVAAEGGREVEADREPQKVRADGAEECRPGGTTGEGEEDLLGHLCLIAPPGRRKDATAVHRGILVVDAWRDGQDDGEMVG